MKRSTSPLPSAQCTALWEGASSGAPKICLIKMWNTLKIKNTLKMIFY
jgi:hypothetical protein